MQASSGRPRTAAPPQKGERSIRELKAELAPVLALVRQMTEARDSMDRLVGNNFGKTGVKR